MAKKYRSEPTNICPYCGEKGTECGDEILDPEVASSTVLFVCSELHLWGRGT